MWLFAAAHEKMWLLVSDRLATPELDSILGHRAITKTSNLLESLDQEETKNEPKDGSDEDSEHFIPVPVSLSSLSTIDSLEPNSQAADIPTMENESEGRQVCMHHFPP